MGIFSLSVTGTTTVILLITHYTVTVQSLVFLKRFLGSNSVENSYEQIPLLHSLFPFIRWEPFSSPFVGSLNPR